MQLPFTAENLFVEKKGEQREPVKKTVVAGHSAQEKERRKQRTKMGVKNSKHLAHIWTRQRQQDAVRGGR